MIYCVEDDDNIRELMLYTLKSVGFDAEGFSSSQSFWQALKEHPPILIILDIMLPEEDGISILSQLRQNHSTQQIPVIMATAKGTEYDKIKGLDMGADDYLVKPFGMMEMISRIRAVLRRSHIPNDKNELIWGELKIDKKSHAVTLAQEKLDLTLKEFELLHLFMENPNRVFTRQELLNHIWGESFLGETRTVDVHIGTLRTKLGQYAYYIKTVRGVGYLMEKVND
ncbi:winged helix-turn-helix domain-containing protein [Streptococcus marimammalium]|uniref:winged helix-turn-helix domain-containing protein n=1 Tax=Streptococcus marimammalium TaxID=269666 RepID=UPI0003726656|nr:response regulator transcription factor [Streptococcus marimammalium]